MRSLRFLPFVLLGACSDSTTSSDGGPDGSMDSGAIDSAKMDSSVMDSGKMDTGSDAMDASAMDASDSSADGSSDGSSEASSDAASDAGSDSASDASSDASDGGAMDGGSVWSTPTCDGTVSAMEYGGSQNQFMTKGGQAWSMAWDSSNLYVALENATISEAVVMYVGWTNGGLTSGQVYDSTAPGSMTFGANAVLYAKQNYNEVRQVSGMAWGNAAQNVLKFCAQAKTREIVIPWSALGANGIPSSFRWVAYATSSGGFVYAQIPETLPGGNIGTNATFPNDYYVPSTNNGSGAFPFDTIE